MSTLVAGVDSSTQSCKVVVCEADTGAVVRSGRASHPDGTSCPPSAWIDALHQAIADAGGIDDCEAISVGGQQHGMVALDKKGQVVRDALLWNDTRSASCAQALVDELGAQVWAEEIGSVPVASFTNTKLRWLRDHEPEQAQRVAAVCLPHDYLTWHLTGAADISTLCTDRSDASGTGYWSSITGDYRFDLLELALGRTIHVPEVLKPHERNPHNSGSSMVIGPGAGDNAAAALGLGATVGDVVISVGTSGVVTAVATVPARDARGEVAGFADATGNFLPLVCTLNAARVLDATTRVLNVSHDELSRLALSAPPAADGLTFVPYLEGERTPNLPYATGALHGVGLKNFTAAHVARAAFEGVLCSLADGLDALIAQGVQAQRILLVGGAAANLALQEIAATVFSVPVVVPQPNEYVALGAARQAAWVLSKSPVPPTWSSLTQAVVDAPRELLIREQYKAARSMFVSRQK